ncbi:MAG: nucleoside-diphosphate sugar epimerase [Candidatus Aenigmatarchaeota archaeon]|nr:MAG: nucleoside-diphosphate sugar epimerase [Candidatus Aenigmarchaeota archaeon]
MKRPKILVTGSSGTIGTRLCERLLESGYEVVGMDIKPNEWNPEINKLTKVADMRDSDAFRGLPGDIGMVIHLAANAMVHPSVIDPTLAMDNMVTVFNALEYARTSGIKQFVFASSREVYGNSGKIKHKEEDAHIDMAESPYTATKLAGEAFVRAYGNCYDMDFVIIRFSNVYGMYDNSHRLIPSSIRRASRGEDLIVYGKEKLLDFTYIDDSVDGVMKAIEAIRTAGNETYNIAAGKASTIVEVVEMINEKLGGKSKVIVKESRTGEVIKYEADISKAKERLGYDPKVGLDEGITRSIEWFRQQGLI